MRADSDATAWISLLTILGRTSVKVGATDFAVSPNAKFPLDPLTASNEWIAYFVVLADRLASLVPQRQGTKQPQTRLLHGFEAAGALDCQVVLVDRDRGLRVKWGAGSGCVGICIGLRRPTCSHPQRRLRLANAALGFDEGQPRWRAFDGGLECSSDFS